MNSLTLEEYLSKNLAKSVEQHCLVAHRLPNGHVRFYLHPNGVDGDTLDFLVTGDNVAPVTSFLL